MYRFSLHDRNAKAALNLQEDAEGFSPIRIVGVITLALGVVSLGLYAGRELRVRYKFRRRTPSDFFSRAGDPLTNHEYGMGV